MHIVRDSLLRDVGVADAVGAGADAGVWQEAAVVERVGARLLWEVDLLNDLYGTAEIFPCHWSYC